MNIENLRELLAPHIPGVNVSIGRFSGPDCEIPCLMVEGELGGRHWLVSVGYDPAGDPEPYVKAIRKAFERQARKLAMIEGGH